MNSLDWYDTQNQGVDYCAVPIVVGSKNLGTTVFKSQKSAKFKTLPWYCIEIDQMYTVMWLNFDLMGSSWKKTRSKKLICIKK